MPTVRIIETWLYQARNQAAQTLDQQQWEAIEAAFIEAERAVADTDATIFLTQSWMDTHKETDLFIGTISAHVVRGIEFQTFVKSYADKACKAYPDNIPSTKAFIAHIETATQQYKSQTEGFIRDLTLRSMPSSPTKSDAARMAQHIKTRLRSLAKRASGQDP